MIGFGRFALVVQRNEVAKVWQLMERRDFLKGSGAVLVVVAGGAVWRAYDQGVFSIGKGLAYEPWKNWRSDNKDRPLALVRAAILAASPHNSQPWLFKVTASDIELYADTRRSLGAFDPFMREMHIGLGCALENMMLAAPANGYSPCATVLPSRQEQPLSAPGPVMVAHIELRPGTIVESVLYDAIPRRHTNRGAYVLSKKISPELSDALRHLGDDESDLKLFLFTADAERAKFGNISVKAAEFIAADPQMIRDSEKWARTSLSETQNLRDGIGPEAAGLPPIWTAIAQMMPPISGKLTYELAVRQTRNVDVATSPLFGLIAVRDRYNQAQNMTVGRVWQRMHLWATTQGLAAQPFNQAVEVVDRERSLNRKPEEPDALAELTGDAAWQPTFMFRMGYGRRPAEASPRKPVKDVVI